MKKLIILLSVFLLFGCTKIDNNSNDYYSYFESIVKEENKYVNMTSTGYKYYLPKGVNIKKTKDNNIILSSENTFLYLYVDVISYYYDKNIKIDNEDDYDYYKELDNDGYLIVDENNGMYLVKVYYNYSTIEFYTEKQNIHRLLTLSSIIVNSVNYNKKIIKNEIIDSYSFNNEKLYEIEELEKTDSNFSQYLNSYVEEKEEKTELPD